jgi:hypothetical protein
MTSCDPGTHAEIAISARNQREASTQLACIRDLMLDAARRGAWLTLAEIAELTEFGEASISAQLRHLRKARHGRYRVEKRLRRAGGAAAGNGEAIWEYRVSAPPWGGSDAEARDRF